MNRDFNFFEPYLNSKRKKKSSKDHSGLLLGVLAALVLAGMASVSIYNLTMLTKYNRDIANIEQTMNEKSFAEKYKKASEKEAELEEIKQEKEFLKVIGASMERIDRVNKVLMDFIAGEVVDNLYLTRVDIKGQNLEIQGVSLTKLGIAQFEYDLRRNGDFEKIHVDSIKTKDNDTKGYDFLMVIDMGKVVLSENQ